MRMLVILISLNFHFEHIYRRALRGRIKIKFFNTNHKHQSAFADRYMLSKDRARVREREREKTGEIAMEINIAEKFSSSGYSNE